MRGTVASVVYDLTVGHRVTIPNGTLNAQNSGCFEADVFVDSRLAGTNGVVFGAGNGTGPNGAWLQLKSQGSTYRQRFGGAAGNFVYGSTPLAIGGWNKILWASNGTIWKGWVNGVSQTLTVEAGSNTGDWFSDQASGTMVYSFGTIFYSAAVFSMPLYGKIAFARYHSTVPTDTEALENHMSGAAWGSVLHEWRHTEGAGSALADSVGVATGTLNTGTVWSTDSPSPQRSVAV